MSSVVQSNLTDAEEKIFQGEASKVRLEKECEFRFEVDESDKFGIKLISGSAEIFGVELSGEQKYLFSNRKLALFTWYGCDIETYGKCSVSYVSEETPMISYINTHAQLEKRREIAAKNSLAGPKILVTGPSDAGKSTLCQLLLNYALRLGRKPTYVDLDIGQNDISIPGTIGATPLDMNSLSVEDTFVLTTPLTYFFGHATLTENPEHYRTLVEKMSSCVHSRMEKDSEVNSAGIIVNTGGWIDGLGYDVLLHCIKTFKIDVVLVLGQDRLYSELKNALSEPISVVKLARSGGVLSRNQTQRRKSRMNKIREYFYGCPNSGLSPCINEIDFDNINFFRVTDLKVSNAMLPVGEVDTMDRIIVAKVDITADLIHSLGSVCHPFAQDSSSTDENGNEDYQHLRDSSSAGFVYIKEVDMEAEKLTLLVPCPGPLPSKYIMIGSVKWME